MVDLDRLAAAVRAPAAVEPFVCALAALFEDAPVGFALLDTDLRFLTVNATLAAVNGVPVPDHLGRTVAEVLPDLDARAVDAVRRVLVTGEPLRDVEVGGRTPASPQYKTWLEDFFRVRAPSGEVIGVAAILADVTARRRGERRLTQLIDSLDAFVGLCLPDGTLVEANQRALDAVGVSAASVTGRKFWDTPWWSTRPGLAGQVRQAVERAARGEVPRLELDVESLAGPLVVDFQIVPVVEHGEVVALVPSAIDVTARRRSLAQATGLASLARRLNAAPTVADVAATIREHTAEAIGGLHATLALVDATDPSTIRLLQSPSLPEHVADHYRSLPVSSPNHIAGAVRTGATTVVRDPLTPDDVGGDLDEFERLRKGRADAGVGVTAATPLFDAEGTVIGALASGWAHDADVDDELLARMRTVAELCAQAIERARLLDAQVVATDRSRALSALAQQLASAVTIDQVWDAVRRLAPQVVGARSVAMGLLDSDGAEFVVRFHVVGGPGAPAGERRKPLTRHRPHSDVARSGEPVVLSSAAELEARYPGLAADLGLGDRHALAVVPLRDSAHRIVGTLAFTWAGDRQFDPPLRATLDTLGELCGQTVERARLHAAEHELVESLQRRLLRVVPAVGPLRAHGVHRPAQTSVGMGGDFYDGIALPDGRLAVVLGDVAGHGMEAAADMAQLQTLLSTLLAAGTPLDDLFSRADAALAQIGGISLATAVAAILDPAARTLTYVHAGHPPLVLRTPDGAAAPLADGRGGLLGVGIAGGPAATVPFGPGSVLVGYTDGLVEVRGTVLDEGIAALAEATGAAAAAVDTGASAASADTAGAGLDPAEIARRVLADCVGDRRLTDDLALLVVSYPTG